MKRRRLREEARQHAAHGQDDSLSAWVQADRLINDLSQLPDEAWVRIPRPEDGYHFLCPAFVQGFPVEVLLDSGAVFSLIWEAALVRIMNVATRRGLDELSPEWPVERLARWDDDQDDLASSAGGRDDLRIMGMVSLRMTFVGEDGRKATSAFALRIVRGGWSRPPLIILGAPTLGAAPAGIGHIASARGHSFAGLGITRL